MSTRVLADSAPALAAAREACNDARAAGQRLIVRMQDVRGQSVAITDQTVEGLSADRASGAGLHGFAGPGDANAFASVDDLEPGAIARLARTVRTRLGHAGSGSGGPTLPELPSSSGSADAAAGQSSSEETLRRASAAILEMHRSLAAENPSVRITTGFSTTREEWRILRDDGTDVSWTIPRAMIATTVSGRDAGSSRRKASAASLRWHRSVADLDPLAHGAESYMAKARAAVANRIALLAQLHAAPHAPGGPARILIDYGTAKGLAHEAFGHAAESDALQSSILGDSSGRFRAGTRVGNPNLRIVDEPLMGDHAWQPFSANGERRRPTVIVEGGILSSALADCFTAAAAGTPITCAGRSEAFYAPSMPRMTNIRIELSDAAPIDLPFEEMTPARIHAMLRDAGELNTDPILYLEGYRGGQVNPKLGRYTFSCSAIWRFTPDGYTLHRPALFSGPTLDTLAAIRRGFGPLLLDAPGTCGKRGQSVTSSGGSHYFLLLDRHPEIQLGGNDEQVAGFKGQES